MAKRATRSGDEAEATGTAETRFIRPIVGAYRGQNIFAGDDYDQAIAEGWAVDAGDPAPEGEGEAIDDLDGKVELARAMTAKWAAAGGPTGGPNSTPAEPPVLTSIDPDTAVIGDPDLTMTCTGEGFDASCVIMFNDGAEPTTFVSPTELTTIVKPSLAAVAIAVPVKVAKGGMMSDPLDFTFTDAAARGARTTRR